MEGLNDTWQADLVEMIPYSSDNKGYKYLLNVTDIFSNFAWSAPLKSKTGKDVTAAMVSILKNAQPPKNLHVDMGKEFYIKQFQDLMKKYRINMYYQQQHQICFTPTLYHPHTH